MANGGGSVKRDPRVLTDVEIKRMRGAIRTTSPTGLRNRTIFELMYRGGLRSCEVVNLRARDVDLQRGVMRIVRSKRDRTREVPMDNDLLHWMRQWGDKRMRGEWWVHTTKGTPKRAKGEQLSTRSVRSLFQRYKGLAGIDDPNVTAHCLRHTCATELVHDPNFELHEVSNILGHASLQSTQPYLHINNPELREKMRRRGEQGSLTDQPDPRALAAVRRLEEAGVTGEQLDQVIDALPALLQMVAAMDPEETEAATA